MEFGTDGCGCAIVARQPSEQLRLAGVRRRVGRRHGETVRYSGKRKSTCVDDPIHSGFDADAYPNRNADGKRYANSNSNVHTNSYSDIHAYTNANGDSYPDINAYSHSYADANAYSDSYPHTNGNGNA